MMNATKKKKVNKNRNEDGPNNGRRKAAPTSTTTTNANGDNPDEQMARDMQLAYELQAKEDQKARAAPRGTILRGVAVSGARGGSGGGGGLGRHLAPFAQPRRRGKPKEESSLDDGFSVSKLNPDHMLFVNCLFDGKSPVALLVDTGASTSAMSTEMVFKLGLESKLNPNVYGNAKGVGTSNIVGVVENVECTIGHVEFRLFFMVLEGTMPYSILGLDQMRRFKCQVDLDEDVLVFGGKNGVSVPLLPQKEAMAAAHQMLGMQQNS